MKNTNTATAINSTEIAFLMDDQPVSHKQIIESLRINQQINSLIKDLVLEQTLASVVLERELEKRLLSDFRKENNLETEETYLDFLKVKHLDEQLLIKLVTRPERVVRYREERWGPRSNSLYLKHKERYDKIGRAHV